MEKGKLRGLMAVVNDFAKCHGLTVSRFKFRESHDVVDTDEMDGEIYVDDTNSELTLVCSGLDVSTDKVDEEKDEEKDEEQESEGYDEQDELECDLRKRVAEYLGEENPYVELYIDNNAKTATVFEPKVELTASVDNQVWGGMDKDYAIRSKLNEAFCKKYLPWMGASPLKSMLQKEFGVIPQLWFSLIVKCKDDSNEVEDFGFSVDFAGDMDYLTYEHMRERFDLEKIEEAVVRNMGKLGYSTPCQAPIDVYRFAENLLQEIPEASGYLKLSAAFPKA